MAYKISGRVISVGPTQTLAAKSGNSYTKRDLIMTVRKFDPYTGYPSDDKDNTPKFTFFGQQCQQLDNIKANDIVVVHFDISGRSYDKDGKTEYFTEVRPFRVDKTTTMANMVSQEPPQGNATGQPPHFYSPGCAALPQGSMGYPQPEVHESAAQSPDDPSVPMQGQASPLSAARLPPKDNEDLPF